MLGALYAALGALTFALNNTAMRRGVLTGTVMQGMAITVPVGALGFFVLALATGVLPQLPMFPPRAAAWLVGQGVIHFVVGRFFNYRANQLVGVNLSAPVVQLQVVVAMFLAVLLLHEPFTVLQSIGATLMLAGSFATQRRSTRERAGKPSAAAADTMPIPEVPSLEEVERPVVFRPRYLAGYLCSAGAAFGYGVSPLMVRVALDNAGGTSAIAGGVIAYAAATAVFSLALLSPKVRHEIRQLKRDNMVWFFGSAVLVTISQAFVYASLAVAPLMVVTPILQLSLIFRLFLSRWFNRDYEVFNAAVLIGAAAAVVGSILVSLNSDFTVAALGLPDVVGDMLRFRIAGR